MQRHSEPGLIELCPSLFQTWSYSLLQKYWLLVEPAVTLSTASHPRVVNLTSVELKDMLLSGRVALSCSEDLSSHLAAVACGRNTSILHATLDDMGEELSV